MKSYHVAHILVNAKFEAEDLLRKLNDGSDFTELAKKHSTCPSAPNGGDLGEIKTGKADADFEDAAALLKKGEITKTPVRTRFGYHLIKRLE